jgi:hypothetical protein
METSTNPKCQCIELGKVKWLRDYNKALQESKLQDKPVMLFLSRNLEQKQKVWNITIIYKAHEVKK